MMTVTKFLVLAVVVAALLPAGREMLDDLARELLSAKPRVAGDFTPDSHGPKRSVR